MVDLGKHLIKLCTRKDATTLVIQETVTAKVIVGDNWQLSANVRGRIYKVHDGAFFYIVTNE